MKQKRQFGREYLGKRDRDYNHHSNSHLLIIYHVPGTVLSILQAMNRNHWEEKKKKQFRDITELFRVEAEVYKTPTRFEL